MLIPQKVTTKAGEKERLKSHDMPACVKIIKIHDFLSMPYETMQKVTFV
jgi:hypothetical protein